MRMTMLDRLRWIVWVIVVPICVGIGLALWLPLRNLVADTRRARRRAHRELEGHDRHRKP